MTHNDPHWELQRLQLTEQLRRKGIRDPRVLDAIARVPRHVFAGPENYHRAYEDKPLPIGNGQTISQPFTVAYMTQLLDVEPGMKVLEIGTGSGYQTAVLVAMGAEVYTVERIRALYERARKNLEATGLLPAGMLYGDGYAGWKEHAPYDRIIITAAPPEIPQKVVEQLKPGGKMVVPVGTDWQTMTRLIKTPEGKILREEYDTFLFVPMRRGQE